MNPDYNNNLFQEIVCQKSYIISFRVSQSFSLCENMKLVLSGIVFLACLFNGTKEGSARLLDRNCGISTIDDIEAHIHDGKITTIRENPWMVKISTKNGLSISFVCSGILITTRGYFFKFVNLIDDLFYIIILFLKA